MSWGGLPTLCDGPAGHSWPFVPSRPDSDPSWLSRPLRCLSDNTCFVIASIKFVAQQQYTTTVKLVFTMNELLCRYKWVIESWRSFRYVRRCVEQSDFCILQGVYGSGWGDNGALGGLGGDDASRRSASDFHWSRALADVYVDAHFVAGRFESCSKYSDYRSHIAQWARTSARDLDLQLPQCCNVIPSCRGIFYCPYHSDRDGQCGDGGGDREFRRPVGSARQSR